jgi:hypothetical protein
MGWDACTLDPNWVVRWFECHPGAGSWAQAILSGVAILAAIAVSHQTISYQRRRDRVISRGYALRLLAPIIVIGGEIRRGRIFAEATDFGLNFRIDDPAPPMDYATARGEIILNALMIFTEVPARDLDALIEFPPHVLASLEQLAQFRSDHNRMLELRVAKIDKVRGNAEAQRLWRQAVSDSHVHLQSLIDDIRMYVDPINDEVVAKVRKKQSNGNSLA